MRLFRFIIDYYDEEEQKIKTIKGILTAESYTKAMEHLEDYVNIMNIKSLFEMDSIVEDDDLKAFLEEGVK